MKRALVLLFSLIVTFLFSCKRAKATESWDDKKTGSKNYRDLVYVDRIEFLDSRSNGNGESMPDDPAEEHNISSEDVPF